MGPQSRNDNDTGIITVTRNGVVAAGSMLGLFSERLPGRLRREPGLSWGDSVNRGRERGGEHQHTKHPPVTPFSLSSGPTHANQAGPPKPAGTDPVLPFLHLQPCKGEREISAAKGRRDPGREKGP